MMNDDLYRSMQKKLDAYSVGFTATESGIEIEILKELFTREEAELFLAMSPMVETPESVAARIGKPLEETAAKLEDMASRGLLFRLKKDSLVRYGAIPFVHGLFEFQVNRLNEKLSRMFLRYSDEGFNRSFADVKGAFLRTIPVNEAVTPELNIAALDDVSKILEGIDTIVVTECICRKTKNMLHQGCDAPMETCFMFGSMARYYLDNNMGRRVTSAEAFEIISSAQKAGLVTQPSTSQNPNGLCNCCGDCCGVLNSVKNHPRPAEIVYTNHFSSINAESCSGCGDCLTRCPMGAIALNDLGAAEVNRDRCIGCGVCVPNCPAGAAVLRAKDPADRKPLPENALAQMIQMGRNRGILA